MTQHLLAELVTAAPPRDREVEAARARARAEKRFGAAPRSVRRRRRGALLVRERRGVEPRERSRV